jgi:DNA-binding GntR family transcriptional regulator
MAATMGHPARKPETASDKEAEKDGRLTRSDQVRRQIADKIISGELLPGAELDEKTLAETFGVSRTPIREALRQLAASEMIEWRPHQSAIVAQITPSRMVEMFEMMAELEGFCGRLSARRMTTAEHADLHAVHKKFEPYVKSGNKEGYHAMNKVFHRLIYAGAHNQYLNDQASALYDRIAPYRAFQLRRPDALRLASEEHQAIIAAIVAGDGDRAFRLLFDHVSLDNELFSDLLSALHLTGRQI